MSMLFTMLCFHEVVVAAESGGVVTVVAVMRGLFGLFCRSQFASHTCMETNSCQCQYIDECKGHESLTLSECVHSINCLMKDLCQPHSLTHRRFIRLFLAQLGQSSHKNRVDILLQIVFGQ